MVRPGRRGRLRFGGVPPCQSAWLRAGLLTKVVSCLFCLCCGCSIRKGRCAVDRGIFAGSCPCVFPVQVFDIMLSHLSRRLSGTMHNGRADVIIECRATLLDSSGARTGSPVFSSHDDRWVAGELCDRARLPRPAIRYWTSQPRNIVVQDDSIAVATVTDPPATACRGRAENPHGKPLICTTRARKAVGLPTLDTLPAQRPHTPEQV